jgi:hypothetical protein
MSHAILVIVNRTSVMLYVLVLGAALALTPVQALAANNDLDEDSVNDKVDNCIPRSGTEIDRLAARNVRVHGVQMDTDADNFGNRCDPDYDNDGIVGFSDFGILVRLAGAVDTDRHPEETTKMAWDTWVEIDGILVTPALADHNADGRVDMEDLVDMMGRWGSAPGPSNTQ